MKIGDKIEGRARKSDGSVYRSWHAIIESIEPNLIVTVAPAGSLVDDTKGGQARLAHHYRCYYWQDKFYNLLELFEPNGELVEIYINIAAPPEFENDILSFKDYELDVVKNLPDQARLIDEDEFLEAVTKYNYAKEFQEQLYAAAREALDLAENWIARPIPVFEE